MTKRSQAASHRARAWSITKQTVIGTYDDGFIHAGNFAYLSIFAVFPFFILGAAIFSAFGEVSDRAMTINAVLVALPPTARGVIEPVALDAINARSGWLLWVGALVALWTASSLVETIRDILRRAYREQPTRAFWVDRLLSSGLILAAVLVLVLLLLAQVAIGTAQQVIDAHFPQLLDRIDDLRLSRVVPSIGVFVTLYLIFLSLTPRPYRKKRYRKWPGALFTALWWLTASTLLPVVLRHFFTYDLTYGSLAGIMVTLFFFWLVGLGLVIGAELNAVLARQQGDAMAEEIEEGA